MGTFRAVLGGTWRKSFRFSDVLPRRYRVAVECSTGLLSTLLLAYAGLCCT